MARPTLCTLALLLSCLGAAVPAAVAATASSCVSTGSTVALANVPSSTHCMIAYGANWRVVSTTSVVPTAGGQISLSGQAATVVYVEFYSDSGCTAFISDLTCTLDVTTPSDCPTSPATEAPTTAATSAPTTAATSAPTTAATSAPTTSVGGVTVVSGPLTCITDGTAARIGGPPTTRCMILYNSNWRVLLSQSVAVSSTPAVLADALADLANIEYYSDSGCTAFITNIGCTHGTIDSETPTTAATDAPTGTTATTDAPTTAATNAPTTDAPTTAATNAPTTDAPTTAATDAPTTAATDAPTTAATQAPTSVASGVTVSAGSPSKCTLSGSANAAVVVPSATKCVALYDTNWKLLLQSAVTVPANGATTVSTGLPSLANVEFYSDAKCNKYINYETCDKGSSVKPGPATVAPTIKATTVPTTKVTTAPTIKATNAPVTGPSRAPKNVRAMYVWMYGDCLFNNIPRGTKYSSQCGGVSEYVHGEGGGMQMVVNSSIMGILTASYITYQNKILNNLMNPWGQFPRYNRIYVEMGIDNVVNRPDTVRAFLVKAHSMGFAVEFLDGVKTWVQSTADAAIPMGYCDQLVAFNQGSTNPAEWIDGIQYDIEPHTLGASWHVVTPGAPDNYNQVYEANLMKIFYHCKAVTRPTEMTLTWSVGNDYYTYVHGLWNPLLTSNPYVDYVTIMNYYSDENAFLYGGNQYGATNIGGVSNILASLQGSIVPAVFVAETMPPAYAPSWSSFWGIGTAALEKTEASAVSIFGSNPLFAGVATHWYATYIELPPNGPGH